MVAVAATSQVYRLRTALASQNATHGFEGRVNIPRVVVRSAIAFFCEMGTPQILKENAPGDGGPLPEGATLQGWTIPDGIWDLHNVRVHANNSLHLTIDKKTKVVQVQEQAVAEPW